MQIDPNVVGGTMSVDIPVQITSFMWYLYWMEDVEDPLMLQKRFITGMKKIYMFDLQLGLN